MAGNRKSGMVLYCTPTCAYGHRVRIVLFEKGIAADIEYVEEDRLPADLLEMNPTGIMPTMVDRDLVLYESRIIMEYLDERFPHPPLHPMEPAFRARARMLVHRIDQDWFQLLDEIEATPDGRKKARVAKRLQDSLMEAQTVFAAKPYFLSDEFSLVDCALAPLLWRLPVLGVGLPRQAEAIRRYAARLFERGAFRASLSEGERGFAISEPIPD